MSFWGKTAVVLAHFIALISIDLHAQTLPNETVVVTADWTSMPGTVTYTALRLDRGGQNVGLLGRVSLKVDPAKAPLPKSTGRSVSAPASFINAAPLLSVAIAGMSPTAPLETLALLTEGNDLLIWELPTNTVHWLNSDIVTLSSIGPAFLACASNNNCLFVDQAGQSAQGLTRWLPVGRYGRISHIEFTSNREFFALTHNGMMALTRPQPQNISGYNLTATIAKEHDFGLFNPLYDGNQNTIFDELLAIHSAIYKSPSEIWIIAEGRKGKTTQTEILQVDWSSRRPLTYRVQTSQLSSSLFTPQQRGSYQLLDIDDQGLVIMRAQQTLLQMGSGVHNVKSNPFNLGASSYDALTVNMPRTAMSWEQRRGQTTASPASPEQPTATASVPETLPPPPAPEKPFWLSRDPRTVAEWREYLETVGEKNGVLPLASNPTARQVAQYAAQFFTLNAALIEHLGASTLKKWGLDPRGGTTSPIRVLPGKEDEIIDFDLLLDALTVVQDCESPLKRH